MKLEDLGSVFHDDEATYVVCERFLYTIRKEPSDDCICVTVGGTGFTTLIDEDMLPELITHFEDPAVDFTNWDGHSAI